MVEMCPEGCGELVHARNKHVEFGYGEHEIVLEIFIKWCPVCGDVQEVQED